MKSGLPGSSSGNPSTAKPAPSRRHLGTVPVRTDLIISLREGKGWSQRTLATHAFCSQATIKNVEGGKEAFPSTLEKIAKALGVNYLELMAKPVSEPCFAIRKLYVKIKFYIDVEFYDFDETDALQERLDRIRQAITAVDGLRNLSVEEGSVAVSAEMTEGDTVEFVRAFCRGRLDDEQVMQIKLDDEVGCDLWRKLANRFAEIKRSRDDEITTFDEVYDKKYLKALCADILHANCRVDLPYRELADRVRFTASLLFEILLSQSHSATVRLEEQAGTLTVSRLVVDDGPGVLVEA
jgi:transcriptional regulator with XRE-family HTH domain